MKLIELAARVGGLIRDALMGIDVTEFDVDRAEPLDIAILIVYDDGVEFKSAFQTTYESEERLALALKRWLDARGDSQESPATMH